MMPIATSEDGQPSAISDESECVNCGESIWGFHGPLASEYQWRHAYNERVECDPETIENN